MKLEIKEKALDDISHLEQTEKDWIMDRLPELEDEATAHQDSGLIRVRGKQVFKYVM